MLQIALISNASGASSRKSSNVVVTISMVLMLSTMTSQRNRSLEPVCSAQIMLVRRLSDFESAETRAAEEQSVSYSPSISAVTEAGNNLKSETNDMWVCSTPYRAKPREKHDELQNQSIKQRKRMSETAIYSESEWVLFCHIRFVLITSHRIIHPRF